jgi:antitoxin ParD1/3/4
LTQGNLATLNKSSIQPLAFRLLEKQNAEYIQWVNEVREKVDIARAEVTRGEVLDGETVVNDILERFRQASENLRSTTNSITNLAMLTRSSAYIIAGE